MKNINMVAVRAFIRVLAPVQQVQDEAASLDAGFDGGEWSGPAHAHIMEDLTEAIAQRIGARFNLSSEELMDMVMDAMYRQDFRMYFGEQRRRAA